MTADELQAFLAEQMVMQCATNGPRGLPHLVPLWFVSEGSDLLCWTYAKSQKAKNLERDPRATIGMEDGVEYHELRGVTLECDVALPEPRPRDSARRSDRRSVATPGRVRHRWPDPPRHAPQDRRGSGPRAASA